jgi:hypothetical protein
MKSSWEQLIESINASSMTLSMKAACLSQAILESGRGTSRVANECLNFWGMKMRPELEAIAIGKEVEVITETSGKAVFAKFTSTDIAVAGWLVFLSRPYYIGWEAYKNDAEEFLRHIGRNWCPRRMYADEVIGLMPEALALLKIDKPLPCVPEFSLLKRGATGSDVETLQHELNEHFDAGLEEDGDFGPKTQDAVQKVEALLGTTVDGIVDSDFWSVLLTLQGLRQDITPAPSASREYMPFAIRMPEIPTRWMYEGGWPTGGILHFTAGRDNPRDTVVYLGKVGYPCLVMGRDGKVYQAFPASRGGYHCGTSHHRYCFGLEVISAGRCTPCSVDGATKYAPWFAYKGGDPASGIIEKPDDCFEEDQMRFVNRNGSRREGWYNKYTKLQESAIVKVFLWYKWADPTNRFDFGKVIGHDEACDQDDRLSGAKVDPGGALSMCMPEFRELLNQKWKELMEMPKIEQERYFSG